MVSHERITPGRIESLNYMIGHVKKFLKRPLSAEELLRTHKGIEDFCYNYDSRFRDDFIKRIGISKKRPLLSKKANVSGLNNFVKKLSHLGGECIFLLKDSYLALLRYQELNKKGFGLLLNRPYLFEKEEEYLRFVDLFYRVLRSSRSKEEFMKNYFREFKSMISNNESLRIKSLEICKNVLAHMKGKKLIWVDMGLQYTFCLFGYCSVLLNSQKYIEQDLQIYSAYPWIQDFFEGNYFVKANEEVLPLESSSVGFYYEVVRDKSAGTLVGFAIGDALGFPVAGIDKRDIPKFFRLGVEKFERNTKHPFFSHLNFGQYTDNTTLLLISAENLIKNNGFDIEDYQKNLVKWAQSITSNPKNERWAGSTALVAINRLKQGKDYKISGSTQTESCSSAYRVIPIGIYYKSSPRSVEEYSELSGMITHNSNISKAGAVITSLIIGNLLNGDSPEDSVNVALEFIEPNERNSLLVRKIQEAVASLDSWSVEEARRRLGTGSLIYQTLPLAIFLFLKYRADFEGGVIAAANSYRDDTLEDRKRMEKFSWERQLIEARGGNTDGIAGLTGAFLGAHLGLGNIPKKFLKVEDFQKIKKEGLLLIR